MKNQKKKRIIAGLTTATLAGSVVAPFVAPMDVSANSNNTVTRTLKIGDDYESKTSKVVNGQTQTPATHNISANSLIISEEDIDFATTIGDVFRISMPQGVKWLKNVYQSGLFIHKNGVINDVEEGTQFKIIYCSDNELELQIVGAWDGKKDAVQIPLYFKVDGAKGELKLTVDDRGSTISKDEIKFAEVSTDDDAIVTITNVQTIGDRGEISTIRLEETVANSFQPGDEVELRLPKGFTWVGNPTVQLGNKEIDAIVDGEKLLFLLPDDVDDDYLDTIFIENLEIEALSASFGDVVVQISGDVINQDIKVAKYSDYSTTIETKGTVPTLFSGRDDSNRSDVRTAEVVIKEDVADTWVEGRTVYVEFPTNVKVIGVEIAKQSGFAETLTLQDFDVDGKDNRLSFTVPKARDGQKRELNLKFLTTVKADAEGEIKATFSGKAGIEGEVVVAHVKKPVTVTVAKTDVEIGVRNQALGDITLAESDKGALLNGKVEITFKEKLSLSEKPTVEVTEGNLEIDKSSVKVDGNTLSFTVKSQSTRASQIKISGLKADLDRTVPYGDIQFEVGGTALVENHSTSIEAKHFNQSYVAKGVIATVVTPVDGTNPINDGKEQKEVVFTIGQTTYKENGVEKVMDVAPFVEGSRAYVPLRYVANAVGVPNSDIYYDKGVVTIFKGNRVAQLTIGSNILTINGAKITMDTKAKTVDGRTVLPIRAVAQALGSQVDYDESTKTVTVK